MEELTIETGRYLDVFGHVQNFLSNTDQASERTPLTSDERNIVSETLAQQNCETLERRRRQPETKTRQPTPASNCPEMHQLLVETRLLEYERQLLTAGYSNFDSFDFTLSGATRPEENPEDVKSPEEAMVDELVTDVPMKLPHARKLVKAWKRISMSRSQRAVPAV